MATFGAALRDPEIFEDPESFRLDRERKEKRRRNVRLNVKWKKENRQKRKSEKRRKISGMI